MKFLLIPFYLIIIYTFRFFLNYLEYFDFILCPQSSQHVTDIQTFDYIIVGAGSGGALLAQRLAENKKNTILLLEAGRHGTDLLNIPSLSLLLQKSRFDWGYETVPQTNACLALKNNVSLWPMGKIVGGTGMLNNMIYVRGHKSDYEEWFKELEDFNFELDILPYFKKFEEYGEFSDLNFKTSLSDAIMKAAAELNYKIYNSNLDCHEGFSMPKTTTFKGKRWTPAHHSKPPNLILKTESFVEKILFRNNFEAYGVKYWQMEKNYIVKAKKGVILSAGVIGSAKLLMLSGIGPKSHLINKGINVIADLPVGENLQDHLTTGMDLILLNKSLNLGIKQILSPFSVYDYFVKGEGPWTTPGCESLAFFNETKPDLQFMIMPIGISEDNGYYLRHLLNINDKTWNGYFNKIQHESSITILPLILHPKSKGNVKLKDKNFKSKPIINPAYLTNEDDYDILIKGIKIIKKLTETKTMRKFGAEFNKIHFPGCEHFKFDTEQYWKCYIQHLAITSYHPVGTCGMGNVVDFNFAVKNLNNLYVVDGSVLPSLPSGNVNGAILIFAEIAADKLKMREFLRGKVCHFTEVFVKSNVC